MIGKSHSVLCIVPNLRLRLSLVKCNRFDGVIIFGYFAIFIFCLLIKSQVCFCFVIPLVVVGVIFLSYKIQHKSTIYYPIQCSAYRVSVCTKFLDFPTLFRCCAVFNNSLCVNCNHKIIGKHKLFGLKISGDTI